MGKVNIKPRIFAILGPTNTGKTHFAMERMVAYRSGIIGFPLRLLARENYERAVRIKGKDVVALITGEEKVLPKYPRYFVCTVEAMPTNQVTDFVAVDEIQMCADRDRGHIFTDRLLNSRGRLETMFLGAGTMRPLIEKLVPDVKFHNRVRFSSLKYVGIKKTIKLPKRSALVGFSAIEVYELAELVRRHLGGAAIVMGALSPRARNAQVAMYQAGEVDYIVATDAIGMGLNMDVQHVAFAATKKFDGRFRRELSVPELAQIAGRAGRYINDGTFGTTGSAAKLPDRVISSIENHDFPPLKKIYWRNPRLNFSSVETLLSSLLLSPSLEGLTKVQQADDEQVLVQLLGEESVESRAKGVNAVRLLWEVCQVPDFGGVLSDGHAQLLSQIYYHLIRPPFILPEDWINSQVSRLDSILGGIEHLMQRIAAIRTWTYVSFRGDWIKNASYWRERTSSIEDKLSDALNESLTQKFVDRRTTDLLRLARGAPQISASTNPNGDVFVEGHFVGKLYGLRFVPDSVIYSAKEVIASKAIGLGSYKILREEIRRRVDSILLDDDCKFHLGLCDNLKIVKVFWRNDELAILKRGNKILEPKIRLFCCDLLSKDEHDHVIKRLISWIQKKISKVLPPLLELTNLQANGFIKGLCFQLVEGLGTVPRSKIMEEIKTLNKADRGILREFGVVIGVHSIFVAKLLKPDATKLRALLWAIYNNYENSLPIPQPGRVSAPVIKKTPKDFYEAIGYVSFGKIAIRADIVEKLAKKAWKLGRKTAFTINADLLSLAGVREDDLSIVLPMLGFKKRRIGNETKYSFDHKFHNKLTSKLRVLKGKQSGQKGITFKKGQKSNKGNPSSLSGNEMSPFAALKNLRFGS